MNKEEPAFPRPHMGQNGMTLRDYFAGQALIGLAPKVENIQPCGAIQRTMTNEEIISDKAYAIADAMLKIRGE